MNSASEDIKDMLADESTLGLTYGTDLFIAEEPDSPDNCVTVFETPGFAPNQALDQQFYFYSSVQIRVRNRVFTEGYDIARNIMNYLHERAQESWNGTLYTIIQATGEPALLDRDGNRRFRLIINFNCQRR